MFKILKINILKTSKVRYSSSIASKNKLASLLIKMPKDKMLKDNSSAPKTTFRKLKNKPTKFTPSKVYLSVLGSGANGAPRCLYMFTDQARYLFNCGEGTQRLAHEHKMKLAKLEHIFITQASWKNIGGLPGLALTVQDVGVPEFTLHGTNGLVELFKATKKFVVMKTLKVNMANCNDTTYQDNVMSVNYVPIIEENEDDVINCDENMVEVNDACGDFPNKSRKRRHSESVNLILEDNTDYYAYEHKINKNIESKNVEEEQIGPVESRNKGVVMCYVCQLTPRQGTLNLENCVKFGVPPGPLFAQLKSGNEIELPSGVIVKPSDVCEPGDPGPIFLVVDCPSESFLNSFLNNEMLRKQHSNDENLTSLVVHFSPPNIVENPRYKEWMNKFPDSTQHLILNESNHCTGSIAVHRIQHKLNLISKENFPLLKENQEPSITQSNKIIQPKTCSNFHLRPPLGFDNLTEIKISPREYLDECANTEGLLKEISDLQLNLKNKLGDLEVIRAYPRVLFLGTGSCIPNKTRNTSGILLQTNEVNNVLIDCGEGTHGQLVRFFGDDFKEVVANINAVYVSHLHADHHIGLIELLQGRQKARKDLKLNPKPVYLLAPTQIKNWLYFYDYYFEDINDHYDLVPNNELILDNHTLSNERKEQLLNTMKMADISTCYVKHCPNAFGVAFTDDLGNKITYSGDTMPCESLINLGINCDLLIHEATMEDELEGEAVYKMHSTTSQAIIMGQRMNAKHIFLTHFSQRYAKLPRLNSSFGNNVAIAFDNMTVKLDELSLIPMFNNALKLMFAEHCEELEMKSAKRQLRIEREKQKFSSN